ncbi:MAG: serine/threonine-protein kinase [Myxococcota bacterium]|nr:serine/threonine-protein kinase [Myxococcota bacterium]
MTLDNSDKTLNQGNAANAGLYDNPSSSIASLGTGSIGVSSIQVGLRQEEAQRARSIGLVFTVVGTLAALWTPFLQGDEIAGRVFMGLMVVLTATSISTWHISRRTDRYTVILFRLYGAVAVISSLSAMIFLGPFSPTALAITLGIGFFGQGADTRGAWFICGSAIVLAGLLFAGVLTGVLTDVGVFQASDVSLSGRLFMAVMVPVVLMVTLLQARMSRDAVQSALESAVESTMEAGRREVQLQEAQDELARLFASEGLRGRMSGEYVEEYRLGHLLGRGATGEVYDAIHQTTNDRVAVKVLNSPDAHDPEIMSRFVQEGEINRSLVSPYIVSVSGYGRDTRSGLLYIVMERLEGKDLAACLRQQDQMDPHAIHSMVHDVCRGLGVAHEMGIIHRDIKPHNIFLHEKADGSLVWKILDFGVSRWASSAHTITRMGGVVGTPRYMSPEQARGQRVDARSDVYSMGAVLYRVLTGRPPFTGQGNSVLYAAAHRRPIKPRVIAPTLSKDLEAVLAIAMAPNMDGRFETIRGLREAYSQATVGRLSAKDRDRSRQVRWRIPKLKESR